MHWDFWAPEQKKEIPKFLSKISFLLLYFSQAKFLSTACSQTFIFLARSLKFSDALAQVACRKPQYRKPCSTYNIKLRKSFHVFVSGKAHTMLNL